MTTHNAYDISYDYSINSDDEELAYNIWEANRLLVIAKMEGNKKLAANMYTTLNRLGYSIESSDASITFLV